MNRQRMILIGMDAITGFLQISRPTFEKWVAQGLPVFKLEERWASHTDALHKWFYDEALKHNQLGRGNGERQERDR